ncbi:hypothetical protein EZV62_003679 [Acer yangbiense]|uniref:Serine-threonine/tyrosine-protein kinase catalytic domain-containing protein n=1 Tax=Acer yangbiense TaxID=1000413 RepID=A0A5C7IIC9_9ROSI|nr:hypothetical protein EZV62_003679 [Acer yangbiense]
MLLAMSRCILFAALLGVLALAARIKGLNLTALYGYCDEGNHVGLIYEYMANGNLKEHLRADSNADGLSWEGRLRIAVESAQEGDIKNIVDQRLQGDFDINSAWKIVELAMYCVSTTSLRRPTMNHVVTVLNDCLAMEMARRNADGNELKDQNVNLSSDQLAR